MNRNLLFIFTIIFVYSLSVLPSEAQARSANGSDFEGVAIGIGGAIVGNEAIQHQWQYASRKHSRRHGPGYGYRPPRHHRRHYGYRSSRRYGPGYGYRGHRRYGHRGYWWMEKRYAPHFYKKAWNPGHYNRYGQWIPGHWVVIKDRSNY